MNKTIVVTASILGMFSIILGAFGAHALKELIPFESQQTFEKYWLRKILIIKNLKTQKVLEPFSRRELQYILD